MNRLSCEELALGIVRSTPLGEGREHALIRSLGPDALTSKQNYCSENLITCIDCESCIERQRTPRLPYKRKSSEESIPFSIKNGDLKFFFPLSIWPAAISTVGLSILGIPEARTRIKPFVPGELWAFLSEWVVLLVVILALVAILPSAISRGRVHLRQQHGLLRKNTELKTAALSFSARTSHLMTKVQDVLDGERDKRYLSHTLAECASYFKQRAIQVLGIEQDVGIHAMLFRVARSSNGSVKLERIDQTHQTAGDFDVSLSTHKNRDAGEIVSQVVDHRQPVFIKDKAKVDQFEGLLKLTTSKYKEYLIVPVYRDGKTSGPDGVQGALMIMSEAQNSFRESDSAVLQTYAWFCSAALAVDDIKFVPNPGNTQPVNVA